MTPRHGRVALAAWQSTRKLEPPRRPLESLVVLFVLYPLFFACAPCRRVYLFFCPVPPLAEPEVYHCAVPVRILSPSYTAIPVCAVYVVRFVFVCDITSPLLT